MDVVWERGEASVREVMQALNGGARVDSLLGQPVVWRHPWWRLTASLGVLSTFITITLGASQGASSARATFNLLSSRPRLAMLTALPFLVFLAIVGRRAAALRASRSR